MNVPQDGVPDAEDPEAEVGHGTMTQAQLTAIRRGHVGPNSTQAFLPNVAKRFEATGRLLRYLHEDKTTRSTVLSVLAHDRLAHRG